MKIMKEKFSIKVNHFAAKTIDAVSGSDKENLGIATLVLIFSGAMMYAGMGTHSLLVIMSGILFIGGLLVFIAELINIAQNIFSKDELDK